MKNNWLIFLVGILVGIGLFYFYENFISSAGKRSYQETQFVNGCYLLNNQKMTYNSLASLRGYVVVFPFTYDKHGVFRGESTDFRKITPEIIKQYQMDLKHLEKIANEDVYNTKNKYHAVYDMGGTMRLTQSAELYTYGCDIHLINGKMQASAFYWTDGD